MAAWQCRDWALILTLGQPGPVNVHQRFELGLCERLAHNAENMHVVPGRHVDD
jgi:hypothetical protein